MTTQSTSTQTSTIYCSACGYANPSWRTDCENCHTKLMGPQRGAYPASQERPGCVTAYAVLLGAVGVVIGVGGALLGLASAGSRGGNAGAGLAITAGAIVAGVLYFLLARGLWQLKNWARVIVIVLQSLGALANVLTACASMSASSGSSGNAGGAIVSAIISLAISGYLIQWFASHGEYFQ